MLLIELPDFYTISIKRAKIDVLGIDIGTVSVKYVHLRGKGNKSLVISHGVFPYNGEMPHLDIILSNIRAREGSHRVAIGISSQDILKKIVTIPVLPKDEVAEALNWTVSKSISTPLDEMLFDYIMLGEIEERGIKKDEACFVGVQKHFVTSLLDSFRRNGFKNIALLTDIGFVYQEAVKEEKGSVAVVDIGGTQTGIYIFNDKKIRMVREILIAGESFSDSLIGGVDVNSREGSSLVERGFREGSILLSDVSFQKFVSEVQRTFNVYDKRYPDKPVGKVFFAGRGSKIPTFMERIRQSFVQDMHIFRPYKELESGFLPSYVLSAHGDGLVNLLPEDMKTNEQEAVYRKWLRIGTVGIAGLLIILSLTILAKLNGLNASVQVERGYVTHMKEQIKALSIVTAPAKRNEFVPFMKEIGKKDEVFIVFLKYLSSRLSGDIYIRAIDFSPEKQAPPVPSSVQTRAAANSQGVIDLLNLANTQSNQKTSAPSPVSIGSERGRYISITGYAIGEVDIAEPALLGFVIKLKDTGLLYDIELENKQTKMMKGKRVVEFTVSGRYGGN
jgi:Tfp pilus assembly PilM family ATPase